MSATLTPEQLQLLSSIETLLADNQNLISLPLTAINQGIAQLSVLSAKAIAKVANTLTKQIAADIVTNSNAVDSLGTSILQPLYDWQAQNELLLTQLAASAGLTQPGDPLTAALVESAAEQPELAYSATLLMALREAMGRFDGLVEVLREIRDRMPPLAVRNEGEAAATGEKDEVGGDTDPGYAWLGELTD